MNRGRVKIIRELEGNRATCRVFSLTFAPLPQEYKRELESHLQHRWELWWDTWVAPLLDELKKKER
ncbi:hypothetical protein LCGC14_0561130 [marine sediment metagenome]|uniref:Uncharacterized protein n=1 Tax=marine sediment metagenome TaxID=412755 RepID=A0A0F9S5P7_9ZZZZ